MKIGLNMNILDRAMLEDAVAAGFDYVDTAAARISACSEEEFEDALSYVKEHNVAVPNSAGLFPPEVMLVGPDRNLKEISDYLDHTLARLQKLGVKVIVLGSGKSRKVPEGYTKEQALDDLAEVCEKAIAPMVHKYDMKVVIEPLSWKETDVLNTVKESVEFFEKCHLPEFRLLVDGFHMKMNGEEYSEIEKCGKNLLLVHIANPDGRPIPKSSDGDIYRELFEALHNIGYDGCITCEGKIPKTDEEGTRVEKFKDTIAFLRSQVI